MLSKVDGFIESASKWQDEMRLLRSIILSCGLTEEYKWSQPCFTHLGKNILIVSSFKKYAFISFFKGSLIKDETTILIAPGENSNSARIIPFTSVSQIKCFENIIREYVFQAIEIEKKGMVVKTRKIQEFEFPEELIEKFEGSPSLKKAFLSLTQGRQRGYLIYFSQAKQSETRLKRIEKYEERILMGKGIRDCVCGHSKRMPNCDGSHKFVV